MLNGTRDRLVHSRQATVGPGYSRAPRKRPARDGERGMLALAPRVAHLLCAQWLACSIPHTAGWRPTNKLVWRFPYQRPRAPAVVPPYPNPRAGALMHSAPQHFASYTRRALRIGFVEMPNYRFKAHDRPAGDEKSGAAVLADDDEALAFANRVIREMMRRDAERYTTSWTMEITAGARNVASVPFESDEMEEG
jgi:hypothetical protein